MSEAKRTSKRVAIAIELHWNLPWHLDTFQGIVDYGRDHGWNCVTDPYLDGLLGDGGLGHYDGVVGRLEREVSKTLKQRGEPAVNLFRMKPDEEHLPSVSIDPFAHARVAAEHLLASGYRRLGYVGNAMHLPAHSDRLYQAFTRVVTNQGRPIPTQTMVNDNDLADPDKSKACRKALTEWIKSQDRPIGLYIDMGSVARYLAQICLQHEIRIPEEVGIVVSNAGVQTATSMTPTLSAIDIDYWQHGHEAARMLDRLMRGGRVDPRIRTISPERVIVRESTDVFLCEDEMVSQAMRYIAEHSRRTVKVDEIAGALGVSRRTLDRRFEGVRGKTVSQEVTRLRIEQIKGLLRETGLPMAKLAELCGFGSPSHFSEYFNKHTGMSPSGFRKQHNKRG